ncbi:MAG: ribonuclease P protein component [Elusimicrobia bacterium]|nr:ribonuclease P protein component [Elusimicrobiota bacterium]
MVRSESTIGKTFPYSRAERIRLDREVEKILKEGRRVSQGAWKLVWLDHAQSLTEKSAKIPDRRIAIRVRSQAGGAVQRNRLKRLLRETFRLEKQRLRPHTDLVVSVSETPNFHRVGLEDMRKIFIQLCQEAKIWEAA